MILVEEVKSMDQIDFQCKQESDEEPRVSQEIYDQKWNCPQGSENLTYTSTWDEVPRSWLMGA